jgi:hypothetical protein
VPDDVGGPPFANGEGPESQDRGAADEAFAAVVLDEDFVEAAAIHEPSAAERILYAALERAESEAAGDPSYYPEPELDPGLGERIAEYDIEAVEDPDDEEGRFDRSDYTRYLPDDDDEDEMAYGAYTPYQAAASDPYAAPAAAWRPGRWQRPVACVLAMVMGISVIAFALIAIQRAGAAHRGDLTPVPGSPAGETGGGTGGQPPAVLDADLPENEP